MSSLAAARADNFYVPNDEKVDSFRNRKRKRRGVSVTHNEEIKVGLLLDSPCYTMGHAYNAVAIFHKAQDFMLKNRSVENIWRPYQYSGSLISAVILAKLFVVETDPKNSSYIYVSGCKRSDLSCNCFEEVEEDKIDPNDIDCAALDPIEELELAKEEQARQNRCRPC